jgi:hypothetical protein
MKLYAQDNGKQIKILPLTGYQQLLCGFQTAG